TGLGMTTGVHYAQFESLTVDLGSGNDSFAIAGTHTGTTLVRGNGGDDTFVVGSLTSHGGGRVDGITRPLTIDAGSGNDVLTVDDTGSTTAKTGTLTATALTGLAMGGTLTYAGLEGLEIFLGSGNDQFAITGTMRQAGFQTVTTVSTGAGNDR